MIENLQRMLDILSSFLGKPKNDYIDINGNLSFEFNCPKCAEENNNIEDNKYNLSITLSKGGGIFQCWKCSTHHDEMKGKIYKLFKLYGNESLWHEYKECVNNIRSSELYKLHFNNDDFLLQNNTELENELDFPKTFVSLKQKKNYKALEYLRKRGIDWSIIDKYNIGFTEWDKESPYLSNRIVIPSYNEFDELNYWTGRDFSGKAKQKYQNPKIERKNIIFNEKLINWDSDIILCEGPFDAIVLPNAIPLLGKSINEDFKIYQALHERANANIIIFLDGDEVGEKASLELYKKLNVGNLYNRLRKVNNNTMLDPSEIYNKWGKKGILYYLNHSQKINELLLL